MSIVLVALLALQLVTPSMMARTYKRARLLLTENETFESSEVSGNFTQSAKPMTMAATPPRPMVMTRDLRICDPSSMQVTMGARWTTRAFMSKLGSGIAFQYVAGAMNNLNMWGHQYLEFGANDASGLCIGSLGLTASSEAIKLQSPDWGVALNSKRIVRCLDGDLGKIEACLLNKNIDQVETRHLLKISSEYVVASGFLEYEGTLSEVQSELLNMILKRSSRTEHALYDTPVISVDISSMCSYGLVTALVAPGTSGYCNCMAFTEQFRLNENKLLSDLRVHTPSQVININAGLARASRYLLCCCVKKGSGSFCLLSPKTDEETDCSGTNGIYTVFHNKEDAESCTVASDDRLLPLVPRE